MTEAAPPEPAVVPRKAWPMRLARGFALGVAGLAALLVLALALLDSSLGHRLVTDRIAALKLQSGLVVHIGRIDGSLFGRAQLHSVVLADPHGRFLTVPDADLDWRPLPALRLGLGLGGGLDIRNLTLHRGFLLRAPQLKPGNPDEPILPDFDVRIDHLGIDAMTVGPALTGAKRRVDFSARAQVHDGRVIADCDGQLGGKDKLALHLDSEPDKDRFALDLDYRAPNGGLLSGLSGVRHSVVARISGAGTFANWHGTMLAESDGKRLAEGELDNKAGRYALHVLAHPGLVISGTPGQLAGDKVELRFAGTFVGGRISGHSTLAHPLGDASSDGTIDLARNRFDALSVAVRVTRPELLPASWRSVVRFGQAQLTGRIDGAFSDFAITHAITLERIDSDNAKFERLTTKGVARVQGGRLEVPLAVTVGRVDTGNAWLDPHLAGASVTGRFGWSGDTLSGDDLRVRARDLTGNLAFKGDVARGGYALAGRVDTHGLMVPQFGTANVTAKGVMAFGERMPWTLAVNLGGTVGKFANGGLTTAIGESARVSGSLHWGEGRPLQLAAIKVGSARIALEGSGSYGRDGRWTLNASGRHADYGAFSASGGFDGQTASGEAKIDGPVAGVSAIALTLNGAPGGYRVVGRGDTRLGPLSATVDLAVPPTTSPGDPWRLNLADVRLFNTRVSGTLALNAAGLDGDLAVAGGGLDGTIHLAGKAGGPGEGGQAVDLLLNAHAARFGDVRPITVGVAKVTLKALFSNDNTTMDGSVQAQGVAIGSFFIGRLLADVAVVNGSGSVTASLAGRRGTRFALQGTAAFAPDKIIAFVAGDYAGNAIAMPRRAIMTRDEGGWQLEPSQINFGSGAVIASGRFGGGPTELHLAVSRMPLSALDIAYADLGLGGFASGVIDYANDHTGAPAGHAAIQVLGLTRSGLVLTSRPLDLALVGALDANALQMRAIAREGTSPRMRFQGIVTNLPRGGAILDRIRAGALRAQLRFAGPADALWRLAAIDAFDLTGPVGVAADVSGTLDNPQLSGAVASHALRAQSAISGSDIQNIDIAGSFNASHLSLAHFSGTTQGGGKIVGSGTIDFSDVSKQRPKIDLRLGATNAQLVNRPEMGATITGPVRLVSDGTSGTIAGRLHIDQARWVLGKTTAAQALPTIAVTEKNTPADAAPPPARGVPWRLLIDADGANRIDVHGMGLESEWQTNVRVRGDTVNPQIFGSAEVIRGSYEFAGKRFDLSRGRIRFNGETPIDPQLDIVATGDANDITATISISGPSSKPSITFASVPSLPEEELLSRILFGSSISQISAPEAVQLAAALASLRSGGGMDPINKLRGAIGLDRLRVLSADATIGRGTSLAVGKYLGRRFYIELVTDGHGYSASSVEFRLTRFLSLLGTISTVEDEALSLKVTKDY